MATKLSALLVQDRVVSFRQMDAAVQRQQQFGGRIGTNLLELGHVDEGILIYYISKQRHMPALDNTVFAEVDAEALAAWDGQTARQMLGVPIDFDGTSLRVAVAEPMDEAFVTAFEERSGLTVEQHVALEFRIQQALNAFYNIPIPDRFVSLIERLPIPMATTDGAITTTGPQVSLSNRRMASGLHEVAPVFDADGDEIPGLAWTGHQLASFFESSASRDHMLLAMLGFAGKFFQRRMLFLVSRKGLRGYALQMPGEPERPIDKAETPFSPDSAIGRLVAGESYFFGPLEHAGLAPLYDQLGLSAPPDVCAIPVKVGPRAALILVGDAIDEKIDPQALPVTFLAVNRLAEGLERLIRRLKLRRSNDPPIVPAADASLEERSRDVTEQSGRLAAVVGALREQLISGASDVAKPAQEGLNELPVDGWDFGDSLDGIEPVDVPLPATGADGEETPENPEDEEVSAQETTDQTDDDESEAGEESAVEAGVDEGESEDSVPGADKTDEEATDGADDQEATDRGDGEDGATDGADDQEAADEQASDEGDDDEVTDDEQAADESDDDVSDEGDDEEQAADEDDDDEQAADEGDDEDATDDEEEVDEDTGEYSPVADEPDAIDAGDSAPPVAADGADEEAAPRGTTPLSGIEATQALIGIPEDATSETVTFSVEPAQPIDPLADSMMTFIASDAISPVTQELPPIEAPVAADAPAPSVNESLPPLTPQPDLTAERPRIAHQLNTDSFETPFGYDDRITGRINIFGLRRRQDESGSFGAVGAAVGRKDPVDLDVRLPGVLQPPLIRDPESEEEIAFVEEILGSSNEQLIEWLVSEVPQRSDAAFMTLLDRGPDAHDALINEFPGPLVVDRRAPRAVMEPKPLERHGPVVWLVALQLQSLYPQLRELTNDADDDARYYAARLLDQAGDADALELMADLLFDTDSQVRDTALAFIEKHLPKKDRAEHPVLARIRARLAADEPWVVDMAVTSTNRLRDTGAVGDLLGALAAESPRTRQKAAQALSALTFQDFGVNKRRWEKWYRRNGLGTRDEWLLDAMVDREWKVRDNAARELRSITGLLVNYSPDFERKQLEVAKRTVHRFLFKD